MNSEILKGNWKQMSGLIKKRWGKLTDDELKQINGSLEELSGAIQVKYGESKESVMANINNLIAENKPKKN